MKNIVVLLSGNGFNLQSIIEYFKDSENIRIKKVFSNHSKAYGLHRAEIAGISTSVLCQKEHQNSEDFNKLLYLLISKEDPDILVLDHYDRILSSDFIKLFKKPIISIHQSLLPKYKGLRPVQDALNSGDDKTGISVHWVDEEVDSGDVIYQEELEISFNDTIEKLESKLEQLEVKCYPRIIEDILSRPCFNITDDLLPDDKI